MYICLLSWKFYRMTFNGANKWTLGRERDHEKEKIMGAQ